MDEKYHHILKHYWGHDSFRPLQLESIRSIQAGRDTLVLMPTGGGKSMIYQIPTLAGDGLCVVITPLISLMKDQVDRLKKKRILAEAIHGGVSRKEVDRILDNCVYGDTKFLYISPERIDSEMFRMRFSRMPISLIAVDEAHCISQWGYDFRPSYLQIARLRELQPDAPVLALTASATSKVTEEIAHHLRLREHRLFQGSYARQNLSYVVRHTENKYEHLVRVIQNVPGTGIIYVRSRERTDEILRLLTEQEVAAENYHGGMDHITRNRKQEAWSRGEVRVMVATNAFGMGIDKADVRFVIHYDIPDSIEAYYQEAGRAGRDGLPAYAVLLLSANDTSRAQQRLRFDFPPIDVIKKVYEGLFNQLQIGIGEGKHQARPFNLYELSSQLKVFTPTLINALKILQQNGYLIFTDEMENPSRIRFIVQRDELYRLRVNRKELDHLITVLLRMYSGLFSDFVSINERELAHVSGYTEDHIKELFKILWQLRIIRFIPSNKSPMIILTEERLPVADIRISPESYRLRQEIAAERLDAMLRYTSNSHECRSQLIQSYFGESDTTPCGRCDICREQKQRSHPEKNIAHEEELGQTILTHLSTEALDIKTLAERISQPLPSILECITRLLEEKKIVEDPGGKMRIIR